MRQLTKNYPIRRHLWMGLSIWVWLISLPGHSKSGYSEVPVALFGLRFCDQSSAQSDQAFKAPSASSRGQRPQSWWRLYTHHHAHQSAGSGRWIPRICQNVESFGKILFSTLQFLLKKNDWKHIKVQGIAGFDCCIAQFVLQWQSKIF